MKEGARCPASLAAQTAKQILDKDGPHSQPARSTLVPGKGKTRVFVGDDATGRGGSDPPQAGS